MLRTITARRARLVTRGLGIALVLALLGGVAFEVRTAHGSGTGGGVGGGFCQPAAGQPTCHFTGFSTVANYLQVNDSPGCQYGEGFTQFGLFVAQDVTHDPPGQPADAVLASAFVSTFDCVTGAFQVLYGTITDADLTVTGNLGTATLAATIPATDGTTGAPGTITVSLRWQGVGTVNQTVSSQHVRTEGVTIRNHFVGDSRLAVVSGSFSDGTDTIAFSGPTGMVSSTGGTVEILRQ